MYLQIELDLTKIPNITISDIKDSVSNIIPTISQEPLSSIIELYLSNITETYLPKITTKYSKIIEFLNLSDTLQRIANIPNEDNVYSENSNDNDQDIQNLFSFPLNYNNITKGTNYNPIESLLEHFDPYEIYFSYLLLDYIDLIDKIQNMYDTVKFTNILTYNKQLINHPITKILSQVNTIEWIEYYSHFLITEIYLDIGGTIIDKYSHHYYNIYMQLNRKFDTDYYKSMANPNNSSIYSIYIPLIFWFNKYNSLALPTIALRYHDVRIGITFNQIENLTNSKYSSLIHISNINLISEYIYLNNLEKVKFTTSSLEYLIEQTEYQKLIIDSTTTSTNIELDFTSACKELWWICVAYQQNLLNYQYLNPDNSPIITNSQIIFNNVVYGLKNDPHYYNLIQPYQNHSRSPVNGINIFSFSLEPENYQPSGSVNLTHIPYKYLQLELNINTTVTNTEVWVFSTRNNILKISNGFAQLLYDGL
jgi:hypothetical protein